MSASIIWGSTDPPDVSGCLARPATPRDPQTVIDKDFQSQGYHTTHLLDNLRADGNVLRRAE